MLRLAHTSDLPALMALVRRVVAERAGHAMHTALVSRLMRDRSAWELAHVYDEEPAMEHHAPLQFASAHA